jgi:hypothetical protein
MSYVHFGTTAHEIPPCFASLGNFARKKTEGMFWHWIPFKKVILSAGNYNIDELCAICTLDMLDEYQLTEHFKELSKQLEEKKLKSKIPCVMCDNQSAYFNQVSYCAAQTTYGPLFYTGDFAGML